MPSDIDLILGSAQSATQALQPYEQRRQDQLNRAQPLSPFERAIALIQAGRLSPREAAVRVQAGLPLGDEPQAPPGMGRDTGWGGDSALGQAPAPVSGGQMTAPPQTSPQGLSAPALPAGGPSYGYTPGADISVGPQMGDVPRSPTPMPPQAMGPAMPPPPQMQIPPPQTRGDLATLMQMGPLMQREGQSDLRTALEIMKEQGRGQRNVRDNETRVRGQNSRASIASAQLNENARQHDEELQLGYDALQNKLDGISMMVQAASQRQGSNREQNLELAAIKLRHSELLRLQSNLASLLNGIANIAENPRAVAEIGAVKGQIQMMSDDLMNDIMQLQAQGTTRGGTKPLPRGEMTPEGINGAPPLPIKSEVKEPGGVTISAKGGGSTTSAGATQGNPNKKVMVVGPNGQSGMAAEEGLDAWLKAHPGWKRK